MSTKTAPAFERLTPEARRKQILAAAMKQSRRLGYRSITRDGVAREAGAAAGLVNRYFENVAGLRDAVMRQAVEDGDAKIVAQGLFYRDKIALKAPEALRKQAAAALAG